ncbi:MAG: sigma-70 family RNA polymerase sigma factor [Ilumatobacter sp.]
MTMVFARADPSTFDLAWWRPIRRLPRQTVHPVFELAPHKTLAEAFSRVQRGDQQAFATVYDELAGKVFGTIKRVLRDPAMSEEVTQEVFVEMWQQAARFDPQRASVTAWALTMARRRAVDRVRREQSQRNRVDALAAQRRADVAEPDDEVLSDLDAGAVQVALGALPADQRSVLTLSFIEGLAHGEIAERLDVPLGTVKGRVRGGLRRLRAQLEMQHE